MSLSISEWFGGDDGDEPRKVRSDGADLTIAERFGQEGAPPPDPRGCGQRGTAMTPEEWESTRAARIRLVRRMGLLWEGKQSVESLDNAVREEARKSNADFRPEKD